MAVIGCLKGAKGGSWHMRVEGYDSLVKGGVRSVYARKMNLANTIVLKVFIG